MAAVTLSHNITRQEDFEGTPGGTFGSTGGGPGAGAEAGLHYEASQCAARRIGGTNSDRGFDYTDVATVNFTTSGTQIWIAKVFTALSAVINPAGTELGIGSAANALIHYQVGDDGTMGDNADFALPPKGGYVIIPCEMRVNAWHNEPIEGSPSITAVDVYELIHNVSATTGAGTSQAMDAIDITTDGLFLVGGDSTDADGTFQDFVDADEGAGLTGASRAGLWQSSAAGFLTYLTHVIGRTDAGTITATDFTDSGFAVNFPGGFVSDGRNGFEFDLGNNSVTNTITLSDGTIAGNTIGFGGRSKIVRYFDTEFDVTGGATDTITIVDHGFNTGDAVIYSAEGGTEDIGPDATTGQAEFYSGTSPGTGAYWYVVRSDADTIQLASSSSNAYAATPTITGLTASGAGNGENHSLTRAPDTRPDILFTIAGTAPSGTATLTRVNLTRTRIITMNSGVTFSNCVIGAGRQLVLASGTLTDCIITLPTTSYGEAYLESQYANMLDEIDGTSFTSGGQGHAIEITTDGTTAQDTAAMTGVTYSGYFTGDEDNTGGISFDANTGVASNQITFNANHNLSSGDAIYYSDEGGTAITGLTDQGLYYAEVVDADTIYMHLSDSSALLGASGNRITLTAGATATHKVYSANATIFNNTGTAITINVSEGDTPSVRNSAGSTTTVNNNVNVTFSNLKDNSEVRIYATGTSTELAGIEDATAGSPDARTFTASISAGTAVDYVIHNWQPGVTVYETIRVNNFTWPSTNQTIVVQQRVDRTASFR